MHAMKLWFILTKIPKKYCGYFLQSELAAHSNETTSLICNRNKSKCKKNRMNGTGPTAWREVNDIKSTCFNSIWFDEKFLWKEIAENAVTFKIECAQPPSFSSERIEWKECWEKKIYLLRTNNETSMVLCGNRKATFHRGIFVAQYK